MPNFTLHRNHILRTTKGHSIQFLKGQPAWVPPECIEDAFAIGAVTEDGVDVLGAEAQPAQALSPAQRKTKLFEAFDTMCNKSEREDFTASGLPHCKKLQGMVGFEVPTKERDEIWQVYTQTKANAA